MSLDQLIADLQTFLRDCVCRDYPQYSGEPVFDHGELVLSDFDRWLDEQDTKLIQLAYDFRDLDDDQAQALAARLISARDRLSGLSDDDFIATFQRVTRDLAAELNLL